MISRCLAGILLGLPASLWLLGALALIWPGRWDAHVVPVTLLFFPLWIAFMSASFLLPAGWRCWAWLAFANLAGFGALWAAKLASGFGVTA